MSQSPPHKIEIANEQALIVPLDMIQQVARKILDDYEFSRSELSIALVDDKTIREHNRQYLDHDWATDVISFVLDLDESETGNRSLCGQLIVSTETAKRLADELGHSMEMELTLYVIHGTLHLCGLDDHEPDDIAEMQGQEKKYLELFGFSTDSLFRQREVS